MQKVYARIYSLKCRLHSTTLLESVWTWNIISAYAVQILHHLNFSNFRKQKLTKNTADTTIT